MRSTRAKGVASRLNVEAIILTALLTALFLLLFIACDQLFEAISQNATRKWHLRAAIFPTGRSHFFRHRTAGQAIYDKLTRHIGDLLETLHMKISLRTFLFVSTLAFLIGVAVGGYWFRSARGFLLLPLMLAALPYIVLRMRLISRQMRSRLDFLPAVEVFYQYYVMSETRNVRQVLAASLAGRRLRLPVRSSFEWLFRHLSTNRPVDDALRIFAFSLGHVWGQHFTNLLRVGLTEGVDLSASLQDLIADMRQAQAADQASRNRLLEIRIANFSPPLFFIVFIAVNLQLNGDQAWYYYMVDAQGRNMLLNGLLLMFASFVMGVWLSMRRM